MGLEPHFAIAVMTCPHNFGTGAFAHMHPLSHSNWEGKGFGTVEYEILSGHKQLTVRSEFLADVRPLLGLGSQ